MAKTILLVGQTFNQTSAVKFIQARIAEFDPSDPLWSELIARHPEKESKIGSGIKTFFRSVNIGGHYQLNILRTDGTEMDVSWRTCLKGVGKSTRTKLLAAFRQAVMPQTQRFKELADWVCQHCTLPIDSRLNAHVDHYPKPFREIVAEFLAIHPDSPTDFDDDRGFSETAIFKPKDNADALKWTIFHQNSASYRLLCRACHLRPSKS